MTQENRAPKKALSKAERQAKLLDRKPGDIKAPHDKHGEKKKADAK